MCPAFIVHACKQLPRNLLLHEREKYEALQRARARHRSKAGKKLYQRRAGIEGTISQGVRAYGVRRSRYRGMAKTHLQQVATAAAINIVRVHAWLNGEEQEQTRISRFAALMAG